MNSRKRLLPIGFRFRPTDEELIGYFLFGKINGDCKIQDGIIKDTDIYDYEPTELYDPNFDHGDGRMYFFTPLYKIHRNGQRAKRDTKQGFWRASQKCANVLDHLGNVIGTKTSLVYYSKSLNSTPQKTSWLMSEYRLPKQNAPSIRCHDPSILEKTVLCVVYYYGRSKKRSICSSYESHEDQVHDSLESSGASPFTPTACAPPSFCPNLPCHNNLTSYHNPNTSSLNPILTPPPKFFSNPNLNANHASPPNQPNPLMNLQIPLDQSQPNPLMNFQIPLDQSQSNPFFQPVIDELEPDFFLFQM